MKKIVALLLLILLSVFYSCSSSSDSASSDDPEIDDTLVGYWPFNGNADDLSGNDNHAIPVGAVLTEDRNGNSASAYYFDGIDDYLDIEHSDLLKPQLPLTVAAWIRCDSTGGPVLSSNFRDDIYLGVFVYMRYQSDEIMLSYCDGGSTMAESRRTKEAEVPASGDWFHFVGIIRGPGDMTIYINADDAGGFYSGSGGDLAYDESPMSMGRLDTGLHMPANQYKGALDQIRIYNRALTEMEVLRLYHSSE